MAVPTKDYMTSVAANRAVDVISKIAADVDKQPTRAAWYVDGAKTIVSGLYEAGFSVDEVPR